MASNMATSLSSVLPGTLVSLLQKFCTSSLQVDQNDGPIGLTVSNFQQHYKAKNLLKILSGKWIHVFYIRVAKGNYSIFIG